MADALDNFSSVGFDIAMCSFAHTTKQIKLEVVRALYSPHHYRHLNATETPIPARQLRERLQDARRRDDVQRRVDAHSMRAREVGSSYPRYFLRARSPLRHSVPPPAQLQRHAPTTAAYDDIQLFDPALGQCAGTIRRIHDDALSFDAQLGYLHQQLPNIAE